MALLTFERLLTMYPAYRTKVVLCVRVELPSYGARAKAALAWSHENNELVERINKVCIEAAMFSHACFMCLLVFTCPRLCVIHRRIQTQSITLRRRRSRCPTVLACSTAQTC
jgi:hypothetical protein